MKISDHICPKDVGLKFMDALKTEGKKKKLQNDVEQLFQRDCWWVKAGKEFFSRKSHFFILSVNFLDA